MKIPVYRDSAMLGTGQVLPGTVHIILAFWHLNEHPRVPGHGHAGQVLPGNVHIIIAFWHLIEKLKNIYYNTVNT
jgi:hypothetical protein